MSLAAKIFLPAEHIALAHVHGIAIIPGSAIVMKVFGGLVSVVAKLTLSNAGFPFELSEKKFLIKSIHTFKEITMLILLDPTSHFL